MYSEIIELAGEPDFVMSTTLSDAMNHLDVCGRAMFCGQTEAGMLQDDLPSCNAAIRAGAASLSGDGSGEDTATTAFDISDAKCITWKLAGDFTSVEVDCDPSNTSSPTAAPSAAASPSPSLSPTTSPPTSTPTETPPLLTNNADGSSEGGSGMAVVIIVLATIVLFTGLFLCNRSQRYGEKKKHQVAADESSEDPQKGERAKRVTTKSEARRPCE